MKINPEGIYNAVISTKTREEKDSVTSVLSVAEFSYVAGRGCGIMIGCPKSVDICPKSVDICPESVDDCPESVGVCPKSVDIYPG